MENLHFCKCTSSVMATLNWMHAADFCRQPTSLSLQNYRICLTRRTIWWVYSKSRLTWCLRTHKIVIRADKMPAREHARSHWYERVVAFHRISERLTRAHSTRRSLPKCELAVPDAITISWHSTAWQNPANTKYIYHKHRSFYILYCIVPGAGVK